MTMRRVLGLGLLVVGLLGGCGDDDDDNRGGAGAAGAPGFPTTEAQAAVSTYKQIAYGVYGESLGRAVTLKQAIDAFVAAPSEQTHQAAKDAWVNSRIPYNQNDAFRFYNGPIDNDPNGPEGALNGWPLNENYIDYTRDLPEAGIINDVAAYPAITKEIIRDKNATEGEADITSGYHAIEFLLWGQDDETPGTGAGKRPYTDFVEGAGGTAKNQARRKQYLVAAAELIVEQLTTVAQAWDPKVAGNYAADFGVKADADSATNDGLKDAIANAIRGMGSLAKAELSGERMTVAIKNRSQEDEHSCFSDTTWYDLHGNALSIQNVWVGQYRGKKVGAGISDVVAKVDPALAAQVTTDIAKAVDILAAFEAGNAAVPFDVVALEADGSPNRARAIEAITALKSASDGLVQGANKLGLAIEFELPSEEL
ncbi:MAG: hypothetical protein EOO74_08125 [Myxococcales bacterium]|nr:MAG: hypothetical protein EOO74_08125 [Myxococcales bacterium]